MQGNHADTILVAFQVALAVKGLQRIGGVELERAEEGGEPELGLVGAVEVVDIRDPEFDTTLNVGVGGVDVEEGLVIDPGELRDVAGVGELADLAGVEVESVPLGGTLVLLEGVLGDAEDGGFLELRVSEVREARCWLGNIHPRGWELPLHGGEPTASRWG